MSARLPTVGGDDGSWGTVLNNYLSTSHNSDGTQKYFINVKDYGALGDSSTDDSTAIQNAINAAASSGAIVLVPSGKYVIGTTLSIGSYVTIQGVSSGTYEGTNDFNLVSCFSLKSSANVDLISIPDTSYRVTIRDMMLDGNNNNNTSGNIIKAADSATAKECQLILENVYCAEAGESCLYVGTNRRAIRAINSIFRNDTSSSSHAVYLNSSDATLTSCIISTGDGNTVGDGVFVNASLAHIIACDIFKAHVGININSGNGTTIVGNGIDRHQNQGVYIAASADGVTITGNTFHSNSQSGNGSYPHIKSDSTGNVSVVSNVFGSLDGGITNKVSYCLQIGSSARSVTWNSNSTTDSTFTTAELYAGNFDDQAASHLWGSMLRANVMETMPRIVKSSSQSLTSGKVQFTYFRAYRNMTITNLEFTTATAAGATPTLIKYGLYSVDSSTGDLTLLSATASDTTMLAANNTPYSKALSASQAVKRGDLLAVAILVVSGASMPTIACAFGASSGGMANTPRLAANLTGQSDMPSSALASSLTNDTGYHYVALT